MSESERMSVYTVSNLEKIEAVVVISISFWRYAYIQCDQVSAVSEWTPVGGAYGEKITIRRCLTQEMVFMQMFAPEWRHLAPQIQTSLI